MDKSWMRTSRTKKQYIDGVEAFIKYVVHNLQKMRNIDPRGNKQQLRMPCPCTTCLNHIEHKVEEVQFHLFKYEIDLSNTKWDKHREKDEQATTAQIPVNATTEFLDDTDFNMDFDSKIPTDGPTTVEMVNATKESFDEDDLAKFQELLLDVEKPLYKGCTDFTKLSAIVKLLNLKGKYGASEKFFTELLGSLKKMLPAGNEMVEKTYQAKKLMRMMGSGYKKIHLESILEDLRWHATRRITDGVLRHPADSQAWRTIDEKFPEIAKDPRNLWLGISADGVDVNSGTRHHSVWPVLSVIYNLPPWLCMKRKFIMLSVLISGYPGNDIDVFLEPLVDDLHTLFETGVDTYDASTKENFNLRAVVLWTINDYPALGTLCGCPYSGFKGCVVCGKDTHCVRLSASSKQSYAGHRRYLPYNHPFRRQKKAFNGQQEFQLALNPLTGEQIYNEVQHIENKWGKGKRTNNKTSENQEDTRGRGGKIQKQKGKQQMMRLRYWRHNSPEQEPTHSSPHDSSLTGVNPSRSEEGSLELADLMDLCTSLQRKNRLVLQLEWNLTEEASWCEGVCIQTGGMIYDIDADAKISLVDETQRLDDDLILDTTADLGGEEVVVKPAKTGPVSAAAKELTDNHMTMAKALLRESSFQNIRLDGFGTGVILRGCKKSCQAVNTGQITRYANDWRSAPTLGFPHQSEGNHNRMAGSDAREATQISKSLLQLHPMSARIKRYMAGLALRLRGMLRINERKSMDEPAKVGGSRRDVKKAKRGTNFVATAPSREGYAGSQPRCAKFRTHHHEKANCRIFLIIKALLIRDHVTQKDIEQYMEDELKD
ncbi:putative transposon, En/Spm-like protein [Tanacetum coccineum]